MSHEQAANIVALRRLIESVIIHVSNNPQFISNISQEYLNVLKVIRMLSKADAGSFQVSNDHINPGQSSGGQFSGG